MQPAEFSPHRYAPAVQALIVPRQAELGRGAPNESARQALEALTDDALFAGQRVVDRNMASSCRAGLWLYHDFLDRSHKISQDVDTPSGSYWHALIHRREGDYSNSKYWFHHVGRHPVFEPLGKWAASRPNVKHLAARGPLPWDPFGFVDLCQHEIGTGSPAELACRELQQLEWELLFDYCYRAACL
jgi:hypothetical protein